MQIPYAQYCRIEKRAGGLAATPRQFIRAAHSILSAEGRSRSKRELRHKFIRAVLREREDALKIYMRAMAR